MSGVDCPPGFEPLFRTSPFLDATGPYFYKPLNQGFIVGLRISERHANVQGTAHGGLLATLADISLGYVTAMSQHPPLRMTTTSLSLDYVGSAKIGDWVEAHVSVIKVGSRMAFANAILMVGVTPVASTRASFMVVGTID